MFELRGNTITCRRCDETAVVGRDRPAQARWKNTHVTTCPEREA